jgi:CHASE3 domain sensor protein
MTIGKQIAVGFAACLAGVLLVAVVGSLALSAVASAKDEVIEEHWPVAAKAHELGAILERRSATGRAYILTGDPEFLSRIEQLDARFAELLAETRALGGAPLRGPLDRVVAAYDEWLVAFEGLAEQRRDTGSARAVADDFEQDLLPAYQEVSTTLGNVVASEGERIAEAVEESNRDRDRAVLLLWVLFGATLAAVGVLAAWLTRRISRQLGDLAARVDMAATEILAGVTQQVSGATQQAAAVQETVATVDELVQTAEQAVERAQAVADRAQQSVEVVDHGNHALAESTEGMVTIRAQVSEMAQSILDLTRRAQSIGDIVNTVEAIAAETHLLALNAAIEAARAGEHGRGFAVVAGEVKALADQSKVATADVSRIIAEIEQGTGSAVVATEEGTRSAEAGAELITEAGQTIAELAETIAAAAIAAEQIAGSSRQQAAATAQISDAMRNVDTVMEQNLAAARQAETTARGLTDLGVRLKQMVGAA